VLLRTLAFVEVVGRAADALFAEEVGAALLFWAHAVGRIAVAFHHVHGFATSANPGPPESGNNRGGFVFPEARRR
jgi:hypothetical protein